MCASRHDELGLDHTDCCRLTKFVSLSLGFSVLGATLILGFSPSSLAQPAAVKPIAKQQLDVLLAIGTVNICSLLEDKTPYRAALKSNIISIGSFIANIHGSQIEGANGGKSLSPDMLQQGLGLQLSYGVMARCEKSIPAKDLAELKKAFADLEKVPAPVSPKK